MEPSTRDKIWRGDISGLDEALRSAEKIEQEGKSLEAAVMRASAFYSYAHGVAAPFRLLLARKYADRANRLAMFLGERAEQTLTDGQCDVIGTILLRRALWKAPNPDEAIKFFVTGTNKPDVPPHSRALLLIGKAEAQHMLGDRARASESLQAALRLEEEALGEPDPVFAVRQFVRVLRRSMALEAKLHPDDMSRAARLLLKAEKLIEREPDPAVRARMFGRIRQEWERTH